MDTNIQAQWIDALTNGTYRQGTGTLRAIKQTEVPTYCCLGVLCDLMTPEHGEWKEDFFSYDTGRGWALSLPPRHILEKAGIFHEEARTLALLNDHGATFEEIAKLVAQPELLASITATRIDALEKNHVTQIKISKNWIANSLTLIRT